jgi:putative MFS transporter
MVPAVAGPPFTPYQRKLIAFLSVACFFEGYDFFALTQILPNLRADMGLTEGQAGIMVTTINVGTVLAYLLVRVADRIGRKRVLTITIAGYTLFTLLTGFSVGPVSFALAQMVARIFLIGEWAISMIFAAEEFPAERRGAVAAVIQTATSLGAIFCAGVMPALLRLPWGWRSVYLTAIVPLALVAFARKEIRETQRFESQKGGRTRRPFVFVLGTPHRRLILWMGLIWGLTYMGTATAVTFWKDFAVHERGITDAQVGAAVPIAAFGSMPLILFAGRLLDRLGRKRAGLLIFVIGAAGVIGAYTFHSYAALTASLVFAIFGASATLTTLNTITAELFPTEVRADAFAWANNLLGRVGYVLSPVVVGYAAERTGYGPSVAASALLPVVAIVILCFTIPETRGRQLEDALDVPL